jgi:hypothetical protein
LLALAPAAALAQAPCPEPTAATDALFAQVLPRVAGERAETAAEEVRSYALRSPRDAGLCARLASRYTDLRENNGKADIALYEVGRRFVVVEARRPAHGMAAALSTGHSFVTVYDELLDHVVTYAM